jgi:conjugal transfer pilus assembly protein TraW
VAALLLVASSTVHGQTEEDEAWLKRSREILEKLHEQPASDWLRQQTTADALAAAQDIATQSGVKAPSAEGSCMPADDGRTFIFISFSIPETTLQALLDEATTPNVVLVLRGVPQGEKGQLGNIHDALNRLKRLHPSTENVPAVIIDPTLFRRYAVDAVPTLVLERGEKTAVRVTGAMTVDWLKRMASAVQPGQENLGKRAESYAIAEMDMILDMQQRMAKIDWAAKRQAAIDNFWKRPREFVDLPDTTTARSFLVDPRVRVTEDIEDADGNVLMHAGDTLNPLDWVPFEKTVVVFRGTDPRHVRAALAAAKEARKAGRSVILMTTDVDTTRGWQHLDELEDELRGEVYLMPQNLVEPFHLAHIPATVDVSGKQLQVKELPLEKIP